MGDGNIGSAGFTHWIVVKSYIKFVFFQKVEFLFKTKLLLFKTQSIKKNGEREVAHSHYMSPSFSSSWQRPICPAFAIDVLQVNKLSSVNFSKCLKVY